MNKLFVPAVPTGFAEHIVGHLALVPDNYEVSPRDYGKEILRRSKARAGGSQ